jgi:hypothetical protein
MVEDLITYIRSILETKTTFIPLHIQLMCIYTALQTLSGDGKELKIDDEFFLNKLKYLILNLLSIKNFDNWDIVLTGRAGLFIKKRDERNHIVLMFVKLLICCSIHITNNDESLRTFLSVIHAMLLKYPRCRNNLLAMQINLKKIEIEDEIADYAMQSLKKNDLNNYNNNNNTFLDNNNNNNNINNNNYEDENDELFFNSTNDVDASWFFSLLKHHVDTRIKKTIDFLVSKDLLLLPVRFANAKNEFDFYSKNKNTEENDCY